MCKLFSRPYPSAVTGSLLAYHFNWTSSALIIRILAPEDREAEVEISVTEEDGWGWDGEWRLLSAVSQNGENLECVRVKSEEDLRSEALGVSWWTETSWVEGSKLVKVRLGQDLKGEAEIAIGMVGRGGDTRVQAVADGEVWS